MLVQENTIEAEDDDNGDDGGGDVLGMMMMVVVMVVMIGDQNVHSAALTDDHILGTL